MSRFMDLSQGDWQRVADHIRAELGRRRWKQIDLAREAGISTRAVSDLANGKPVRRMPPSAVVVESVLGWPPGAIVRLLSGGTIEDQKDEPERVTEPEPEPLPQPEPPPVFETDDEVAIWNLRTIPEQERRELIDHLRYLRYKQGLQDSA